jgi:creatinine amidohydrolase
MSWLWEDLTAPRFAQAVAETRGVCVLPLGVIEKHGGHLPLGTDVFAARAIAERAAELEPAVIFPFYFFGQIHCAKHCPGTVAIRMRLAIDLLENVCGEIARNGLRKIILLNGHGGNIAMVGHFARMMLEERRDYVLHVADLGAYLWPALESAEWKAARGTDHGGHADEAETSMMLDVRPELVRMDEVAPPADGRSMGRLDHVRDTLKGIGWYANYPNHYAGDARPATAGKGRLLMDLCVRKVAAIIRAVKEDSVTGELEDEFFGRIDH